jgi:glycosyltransferase involved in cell wall biosynthesis
MKNKPRLLRITTAPISLKILLNGQLTFFEKQGFELLAASAAGKDVEFFKREGIKHQVVPMTRKITPFQDLLSLISLVLIIRKFKPHIVHTHTPKAGLLGMIAAWLCGTPIRLHTVAGLPLMETRGFTRKLLMLTERITYGCATAVYSNSKGLKTFIEKELKPGIPILMIGKGSSNGIDTAHFDRTPELENESNSIRARYGIEKGDLVFSFVGRIVKDKGITELIEAFKSIRLKNTGALNRLFLMLIGPFEQELDPLSEEDYYFLKNDLQVILAGFQTDVRPWILASDVFTFPSYREGFPNVVLQACSLKVPCIVSDINGCNEIIDHNNTGLIVPAKDSARLAEAMQLLKTDHLLRQVFSERSREIVVANFSQQYIWSELLNEYQRLLKSRVMDNF